MTLNQYAMISLDLYKDITVSDKVVPNIKFQLFLPQGISWEEAMIACDDFKIALGDMKKRQEEALAAQAEAKGKSEVIEPEVMA